MTLSSHKRVSFHPSVTVTTRMINDRLNENCNDWFIQQLHLIQSMAMTMLACHRLSLAMTFMSPLLCTCSPRHESQRPRRLILSQHFSIHSNMSSVLCLVIPMVDWFPSAGHKRLKQGYLYTCTSQASRYLSPSVHPPFYSHLKYSILCS